MIQCCETEPFDSPCWGRQQATRSSCFCVVAALAGSSLLTLRRSRTRKRSSCTVFSLGFSCSCFSASCSIFLWTRNQVWISTRSLLGQDKRRTLVLQRNPGHLSSRSKDRSPLVRWEPNSWCRSTQGHNCPGSKETRNL
jgi:hypothetical protein